MRGAPPKFEAVWAGLDAIVLSADGDLISGRGLVAGLIPLVRNLADVTVRA